MAVKKRKRPLPASERTLPPPEEIEDIMSPPGEPDEPPPVMEYPETSAPLELPIPAPPGHVLLSISLTPDLMERVTDRAQALGMTIEEYARLALESLSLDSLLMVLDDDPALAREAAHKALREYLLAPSPLEAIENAVESLTMRQEAISSLSTNPEPPPPPSPPSPLVNPELKSVIMELAQSLGDLTRQIEEAESRRHTPPPVSSPGTYRRTR
jgi:DNA-binding NarL/FixJ family response regulator